MATPRGWCGDVALRGANRLAGGQLERENSWDNRYLAIEPNTPRNGPVTVIGDHHRHHHRRQHHQEHPSEQQHQDHGGDVGIIAERVDVLRVDSGQRIYWNSQGTNQMLLVNSLPQYRYAGAKRESGPRSIRPLAWRAVQE